MCGRVKMQTMHPACCCCPIRHQCVFHTPCDLFALACVQAITALNGRQVGGGKTLVVKYADRVPI